VTEVDSKSATRRRVEGSSPQLSTSDLTYQWQIESVGSTSFTNLTGATSSNYVTTAGMEGDQLRLVVTFTETAGTFTTTDTVTTTPVTIQEKTNEIGRAHV